MALNVIGESGVRIRPVTSGFVPELQAYIDQTAGRVGAEVPLTLGAVQLEGVLDQLRASIEGGAVLPLGVARQVVDDTLTDIQKKVSEGAEYTLGVQDSAVDEAITDARNAAESGAEMPLTAADAALQEALVSARALSEEGAEFPLYPGDAAVEEALGRLRGEIGAGETFPITLSADEAIAELVRLRDAVANSGGTLPIDTSGAVGNLTEAELAAQQFGDRFGGVIGNLQNQIAGLNTGIGSIGQRISRLLGGPAGAIIGGGAIAGAFAGANVIAAGNDRLTRIEDSVAALEIQLGGAAEAAALVDDVLQTVKGTPFNLDQFIQAARTLVTFGTEAEKIPTYLTAIGEAAAGSGQGIEAVNTITDVFAKMQIAGRVTTDDWQRLGFVGVNALKILGNAYGKTAAEIQEMVTNGLIPANEAIDYIIDGITNGSNGVAGQVNKLGGSMEKLRNTFSGAAGGLQAASARFGVAFLEPFRPTTVALIQTATDALDALSPVVKTVLTSFTESSAVQSFIAVVSEIPNTFDQINAALERGGIGGAIQEILSLTGPLEGTLSSIFNNIQEAIAPLGRIIRDVVAGIGDAITILGAGFFLSLRGIVNVVGEIITALDAARPVVRALAAALAALFVVKKFELLNSVLTRLNGITKSAAAAARDSALAQGQETVATNANTAAKERLTLAQRVAARETAAAAAASRAAQFRAAQAGAPVFNNLANAPITASNDFARVAAADAATVGQRWRSSLSSGIRRARTAITDFGKAFRAEIALVAGFLAFQLTQNILEGYQNASQERGREGVKDQVKIAEDARKNIERQSKGNTFSQDVLNGAADYFGAQAKILDEASRNAEILRSNEGAGGVRRQIGGALNNVGIAIAGLVPEFGAATNLTNRSTDTYLAEIERAKGANGELTEQSRKLRDEFVKQTRGWGTLASAIGKTGDSIELLGAKRLTDPGAIGANVAAIEERLIASKTAAKDGDSPTARELEAIREQAKALGQFDLPTLEAALEAAGIDLADADLNSEEFAKAIAEAAAETREASADAVGLSSAMGTIAQAYDNAKTAAEEYVSIAFAQQNAWIEGQVAADNYNSALAELQFSTDFTASNLQNISQAMQAQITSTYQNVQAQAELAGSTDSAGDAARAAAAEEARLRDSFIEAAVGAGKTRAEAENLANALLGIPGSLTVSIQINVLDQQLDALDRRIEALQGNPIFGAILLPSAQRARDDIARQQQEYAFYQGILNAEQQQAQRDAAAAINSSQQQQAAQQARQDAARAAEQARRDAEQAAERARQEAERAAEEERRRREKELADFLQVIQGIRNASEQMKGSFEQLINTFRQKRQELIGDINKRVEFDPSASVARLIRNADQRNAALTEAQKGLTDLRRRGLSEDAIKSIGLTGRAEDAKAIRRLLKASPEELKALSASVGKLGETATQAAYREQGQIIGREIRDVLDAWVDTPGVRNPNVTVEQILKIIRDSRGDSEKAASRITRQLGGVVKR